MSCSGAPSAAARSHVSTSAKPSPARTQPYCDDGRRGAGRVFELGNARDEDIVRRIYDLGCIFEHFPRELTDVEAGRLARELLLQDALEFDDQDPGFRDAPIERAREALNDLAASGEARQWYERFTTAMVYGVIPPFDAAMGRILKFADAWVPSGG